MVELNLKMTVDQWKTILEMLRVEYSKFEDARLEILSDRGRAELEPNEELFYRRCFDRATFLAEVTRGIISDLKKQGINTV